MSDPTPPVTPAADLADEAAHERVARAIHAGRFPKDPDAAWTNLKVVLDAGTIDGAGATVRDYEQTTIGTADRYAEWIAGGTYDWMSAGVGPGRSNPRVSAEERSPDEVI